MMKGLDWEAAANKQKNEWCFPPALAWPSLRVGGRMGQTITQDSTESPIFEQMGTK